MRIDVAFTPAEPPEAAVAIVIDVLRATTTIVHALGQGYERVLACAGLNGTRAIVTAAGRADTVLVGSLANLTACAAEAARTARKAKGDVLVQCAGVVGEFAIDDAYTAGRFVAELRVWLAEWEASDSAQAAEAIASAFASAADGLGASQSARNLRAADLADDVRYCAREGVLDIVPTVGDVDGDVALITA